jgi:hypothetical protein
MEKESAIEIATRKLEKLLEYQPHIITAPGDESVSGKAAAEFCIDFIESYAAWLTSREKAAGRNSDEP